MLGVTACQKADSVQLSSVNQEWVDENAKYVVEAIVQLVESNQADMYIEQNLNATEAEIAGIKSYQAAQPEIGNYQAIESNTWTEDGTELTIISTIIGSERKAEMEIIVDQNIGMTSCTTNVIYSFGETMAKAGLNTLMGMGTVFIVLILIAMLISSFSLISKIQNAGKKKEKATESAVANAVAQIVENEEAQEDDLELIAVIAAAIAASEGAASADGYVVRSIRKIR